MDIITTIPNEKADIVKAALSYQDEVLDESTLEMIPNPETPKQFLENYIEKLIIRKVRKYINDKKENKSDWEL